MDLEFGRGMRSPQRDSWKTTMLLAYQSLGVVYGDLSISPLYVFKSTFAEDIQHSDTNEEIFGVLSFVFWTLTLIPLIKYVSIVLRAHDNGEGTAWRSSGGRRTRFLRRCASCRSINSGGRRTRFRPS